MDLQFLNRSDPNHYGQWCALALPEPHWRRLRSFRCPPRYGHGTTFVPSLHEQFTICPWPTACRLCADDWFIVLKLNLFQTMRPCRKILNLSTGGVKPGALDSMSQNVTLCIFHVKVLFQLDFTHWVQSHHECFWVQVPWSHFFK